jgi:hypothetical protein
MTILYTGYIEESVSRIETACHSGESSSGPSTSTAQDKPSTNTDKSKQEESTSGYKLGGTTDQSHELAEVEKPDADEMRQKRLAFLSKLGSQKDSSEQNQDKDTKENCSCDNPSDVTVNGTNTETEVSGKEITL